ncbi:hypothetical protein lerEdw1_020693, partial [Lerista edwardsae]
SFLQLAAIVVRCPMEKQNPTVPQNERSVGTGEASHVPQPSASPPRTEEGEEDLSAGRAPRWEDQWLDFLERVKSRGMLEEEEEEALWGESFLQLAAIVVRCPMEKQNPTVPQNERSVGTGEASHVPQPSSISTSPPRTEEGEKDLSAGRAPRWEDQWLDFLERVKSQGMLEEEEEEALWDEAKVAAGTSSSTGQKNPPDHRQEEAGTLSLLAPDQRISSIPRVGLLGQWSTKRPPGAKILRWDTEEVGAPMLQSTRGSFLQLAAIVVRCPMEKQNPTVPLKERPVGTGEAPHVPQPSSISTSPPWTEVGEEDLSAGRAPRWEDQWLDFLERVKSQKMLEEEEVATGTSSSTGQENPPDHRQEGDGALSLLEWLLSDCENEGDQLGMLLERGEEETLRVQLALPICISDRPPGLPQQCSDTPGTFQGLSRLLEAT